MEQVKFYKYTTFVLVILNLSMVAFFFLMKPKGQHHNGRNVVEILKLEKTQNDTFLQYADAHKALMKEFDEQQKALLKTYFQTLTDTTDLAITDSLLTEVQKVEREKIESTYEHLEDVRSILNEEQQPYFQEFMNRVYGRILSESTGNKKK